MRGSTSRRPICLSTAKIGAKRGHSWCGDACPVNKRGFSARVQLILNIKRDSSHSFGITNDAVISTVRKKSLAPGIIGVHSRKKVFVKILTISQTWKRVVANEAKQSFRSRLLCLAALATPCAPCNGTIHKKSMRNPRSVVAGLKPATTGILHERNKWDWYDAPSSLMRCHCCFCGQLPLFWNAPNH